MSLNFLSKQPTKQELHERSDEQQNAIEEFLRSNDVEVCQPAGAASNEASRGTKELIAMRRRQFRKLNK